MSELWRPTHDFDRSRQPLLGGGLDRIESGKEKKLRIKGGISLSGTLTIDDIRGTKNIVPPIFLAASLIARLAVRKNHNEASIIRNVPNISELAVLDGLHIARMTPLDESSILVTTKNIRGGTIEEIVGKASRTSLEAAPVLLITEGYANVPLPEGDELGGRDITTKIEILKAFGAQVDFSVPGRLLFSASEGLRGCNIELPHSRITDTNTAILAATGAEGHTTLKNASLDIEVDALIFFLTKAGVTIKRRYTDKGIPTKIIDIDGTKDLHGVDYTIPVDRSAIVTYAVAALATKSREGVFMKGAQISELYPFMGLVYKMGGGVEIWNDSVHFYYKGPLRAPERTVISMNQPYIYNSETAIGFYADWQPLVTPLFLQAEGTTRVIETAHPYRLDHLRAIQEQAAQEGLEPISFFNPSESDLPAYYLFDASRSNFPHGALITGGYHLRPFEAQGNDIRSAAFWAIQGLATPGTSTIHGIHQLERGYHDFDGNIRKLGAQISVE